MQSVKWKEKAVNNPVRIAYISTCKLKYLTWLRTERNVNYEVKEPYEQNITAPPDMVQNYSVE